MGSPSEDARAVLDLVMSRPATLGGRRLLCVDGPAGAGKTTLASALAELEPSATVVHTDEMLGGWQGLPDLADSVRALLDPLARGELGTWRRWDWRLYTWAETHIVEPSELIIVEGVGAWSGRIANCVTALVWVEAPHGVRMRRGLERDGDDFAPHWAQWAHDEEALFTRERTRDHADMVIRT